MKLAIAWTEEAKETFDHTILQIEALWGANIAGDLLKKLTGLLTPLVYNHTCLNLLFMKTYDKLS